jgi:hypothetical protein
MALMIVWLMNVEQLMESELAGKTEVLGKKTSATFSTTNYT